MRKYLLKTNFYNGCGGGGIVVVLILVDLGKRTALRTLPLTQQCTHEKQLYFRNLTGSDWAFFHFSALGRYEEKAKMKLTLDQVAFDPRF